MDGCIGRLPKHPEIVVPDVRHVYGNIYTALITVKHAMRRNGIPESEIRRYRSEAMAGYVSGALSGDHGLFVRVTERWVTIRCEAGRRCD